jgi:hypothetical protein
MNPIETQTAVTFKNRAGLTLFGVLHTPAAPAGDLAVILLSPGVKMRVGPEGLYRRLTDQLVRMGVTVFRFDFYGLGDSEGTLDEELLRDVYNHIEVGRFVDDTFDAMDWMQQHTPARRFVLSGLCGGAITGLLAGGRDARVAGLLALGITPVLAAASAEASLYMTVGQLEESRRKYVRRLANPRSWMRLLTLQSDYKLIMRFMLQPFRRRPAATSHDTEPPPNDNANPLFPPAFFTMAQRQRPMLYVFGGSDRLQWEFEEKFVARHRSRLAAVPDSYDVHVIKDANHVLSLRHWQNEMLDVAAGWMAKRFAGDLRPAGPDAIGPAAGTRAVQAVGVQR